MSSIEDVVRRRMGNTGESYAVAYQAVLATLAVMRRDADDAPANWTELWTSSEPVPRESILDYVRKAPDPAMLDVFLRMPPLCLVRSRAGHLVPPEGRVAIVSGLAKEADTGAIVAVVQLHPASSFTGQVLPDELEVAGYRAGITPEVVASVVEEVRSVRFGDPITDGYVPDELFRK